MEVQYLTSNQVLEAGAVILHPVMMRMGQSLELEVQDIHQLHSTLGKLTQEAETAAYLLVHKQALQIQGMEGMVLVAHL